jgi:hypothetical protein
MVFCLYLLFSLSFLVTANTALSPVDKRQVLVVKAGYANLVEKSQADEVAADVQAKIQLLVDHLASRNFTGANTVQTVSLTLYHKMHRSCGVVKIAVVYLSVYQDLANTAWNLHKEWIKAVKILIQLLSKK